jgi:Mor family transcriptional regulator
MNGIVYRITNNVNGMRYVGQTTQKLSVRWAHHCSPSAASRTRVSAAIQEYGKENFTVEVLQEGIEDLWTLFYLEAFHILEEMCVWPYGYNSTFGGMGRDFSKTCKRPELANDFTAGKSVKEMAAAAGITAQTVRQSLHRLGVDTPRRVAELPPELPKLYNSGLSCARIAALYGWSEGRVYSVLAKMGVELRPRRKRFLPLDEIFSRYEKGETVPQLAKAYGCSTATIYSRFEDAGIKTRYQGKRVDLHD